jgi:hypothetical protein
MVWRKGGNLARAALAAETRHEVAEAAMRVTKLLGDQRQGALVAEDSAQSLVAALDIVGRLAEEVFTQGVIPSWTSGSVMAFWEPMSRIGMFIVGTIGKEKTRQNRGKG